MILFEKLPEKNLIPYTDERAKHIVNVLHLHEGDSFKMGLINQSEGLSKITSINEEGVGFEYVPQSVPALYPVTLIIAQVRPICMKRILREVVSLGVGTIILTGSDTGEKSYRESNFYRDGEYKEYLLDGAMQAAHAGLPEVLFADYVGQAVELSKAKSPKASFILLDNVTGAKPLSVTSIEKQAVLAIGPERGWSSRERDRFVSEGFVPCLLGCRVLRTETACSAGTAVLLSRMKLL